MVDFQSRDTRRGIDDAEDDETAEPDPTAETTAHVEETAGFAVVSVAREPSIEDDPVGDAAVTAIESAGEQVATQEAISPSYDGVQRTVGSLADREDVAVVVTVGGTGIEPDDVTVDAIDQLLDKDLPGFGELFRMAGYEDVGAAVIGTRAMAGVFEGVPVFCLPGEVDAVRRGMQDLVLEQAIQLARLARTDGDEA